MRLRRVQLLAVTAASALLISGCMVGPDYVRPEVDVPETFRAMPGKTFEAEQWLKARWWTEYGDPALNQLVSKALENNRTLQQTMANVEMAAASVTVARSALFPQVDYSAYLERDRASETTISGASLRGRPYDTRGIMASASWELDLWGKIRRQTEGAMATLRSTEAAHKAAISSVIGSVVSTYLNILMIDEQLRIARTTARSYKATYDLFKIRSDHGNVSDMEVMQAKSQWESAKVEIPSLTQTRVELINSLSILTGIDVKKMPKFKRITALKIPKIVKGVPSRLLEERPDVVQAEEQLIASNADIGVAKSLYFPSISLTGGYGFSSEELKHLVKAPSRVWTYAVDVGGPIFHGGAIQAGVRSAEAETKGSLAAYQLAVAQAFVDVDNALSKRQNTVKELQEKTALVQSLREYERLADAQYQEGYTSYTTVLQAEQSLLPQQLSLVSVRADALASVAQIYQALGGGWIDEALTEELGNIEAAEAKANGEPVAAQDRPGNNIRTIPASNASTMVKEAEANPNQIIESKQ